MSLSKFIPSQCSWQLVSRQHSFVQTRSCVAPLIFINTSFPSQFFGVFTVVYGIPETRTHYSSLKTAARLSTYPKRSCTLHHSAAIVIKYLGMVRDVSSFLSFINTIIYFLCVDFSHIVGLWSILIGIMWSEGQKIHRTQVTRLCRFLCP